MTVQGITTIGFVGAGRIGSQLARLAVRHGYRVVLSNSRGPETLADLVAELGDRAAAGTTDEAAAAGDVVVVTIPVGSIGSVPAAPLTGKVVLDTGNYYARRDGRILEIEDEGLPSTALLQRHLPGARIVKAFNHIAAPDLTTADAPTGTPGRRALAVYGDDPSARSLTEALIDDLGFDTVDGGPLSESRRIEPGTPGYGVADDVPRLTAHLAAADRTA